MIGMMLALDALEREFPSVAALLDRLESHAAVRRWRRMQRDACERVLADAAQTALPRLGR